MKRCLFCKEENLTGGEWCSVRCEEEHMYKINKLKVIPNDKNNQR